MAAPYMTTLQYLLGSLDQGIGAAIDNIKINAERRAQERARNNYNAIINNTGISGVQQFTAPQPIQQAISQSRRIPQPVQQARQSRKAIPQPIQQAILPSGPQSSLQALNQDLVKVKEVTDQERRAASPVAHYSRGGNANPANRIGQYQRSSLAHEVPRESLQETVKGTVEAGPIKETVEATAREANPFYQATRLPDRNKRYDPTRILMPEDLKKSFTEGKSAYYVPGAEGIEAEISQAQARDNFALVQQLDPSYLPPNQLEVAKYRLEKKSEMAAEINKLLREKEEKAQNAENLIHKLSIVNFDTKKGRNSLAFTLANLPDFPGKQMLEKLSRTPQENLINALGATELPVFLQGFKGAVRTPEIQAFYNQSLSTGNTQLANATIQTLTMGGAALRMKENEIAREILQDYPGITPERFHELLNIRKEGEANKISSWMADRLKIIADPSKAESPPEQLQEVKSQKILKAYEAPDATTFAKEIGDIYGIERINPLYNTLQEYGSTTEGRNFVKNILDMQPSDKLPQNMGVASKETLRTVEDTLGIRFSDKEAKDFADIIGLVPTKQWAKLNDPAFKKKIDQAFGVGGWLVAPIEGAIVGLGDLVVDVADMPGNILGGVSNKLFNTKFNPDFFSRQYNKLISSGDSRYSDSQLSARNFFRKTMLPASILALTAVTGGLGATLGAGGIMAGLMGTLTLTEKIGDRLGWEESSIRAIQDIEKLAFMWGGSRLGKKISQTAAKNKAWAEAPTSASGRGGNYRYNEVVGEGINIPKEIYTTHPDYKLSVTEAGKKKIANNFNKSVAEGIHGIIKEKDPNLISTVRPSEILAEATSKYRQVRESPAFKEGMGLTYDGMYDLARKMKSQLEAEPSLVGSKAAKQGISILDQIIKKSDTMMQSEKSSILSAKVAKKSKKVFKDVIKDEKRLTRLKKTPLYKTKSAKARKSVLEDLVLASSEAVEPNLVSVRVGSGAKSVLDQIIQNPRNKRRAGSSTLSSTYSIKKNPPLQVPAEAILDTLQVVRNEGLSLLKQNDTAAGMGTLKFLKKLERPLKAHLEKSSPELYRTLNEADNLYSFGKNKIFIEEFIKESKDKAPSEILTYLREGGYREMKSLLGKEGLNQLITRLELAAEAQSLLEKKLTTRGVKGRVEGFAKNLPIVKGLFAAEEPPLRLSPGSHLSLTKGYKPE